MGGRAARRHHSLRKTRYSRVKGAARSSLLKPLMVSETHCHRYSTTRSPDTKQPDERRKHAPAHRELTSGSSAPFLLSC